MPVIQGTVHNRKEFTGKEFDYDGADAFGENGMNLYYFGKRYYDPEICRWISTDPSAQFFDFYAYTGNGYNPLISIDPDGEAIYLHHRFFTSWQGNEHFRSINNPWSNNVLTVVNYRDNKITTVSFAYEKGAVIIAAAKCVKNYEGDIKTFKKALVAGQVKTLFRGNVLDTKIKELYTAT